MNGITFLTAALITVLITALITGLGAIGLASAKDPATITLDPGHPVVLFRVYDGDTFKDRDGQAYRLHGIDAPELCQPWGPRARLELAGLLSQGQVWIWRAGKSYQRQVVDAMVLHDDGISMDVAAEMLRAGLAIVDDRYVSGPRERALLAIEEGAKTSGAGMWAHHPESPRDWRAEHRGVRPPGCVH